MTRVGLVHGLGETSACWSQLLPLLGDARVEAPDLPWGATGDPAWPAHRDLGPLLVEAFGGALPDVLVAHSFGAGVALELLTSPGGPPPPRALLLLSPFYRGSADALPWSRLTDYRVRLGVVVAEGLRARGTSEHLVGTVTGHVAERIGPWGWLRFLDTYLRTPALDLAALDVPTVVIAGADDAVLEPGSVAELAARLPQARHVELPACGHFPMLQQVRRTAALVDLAVESAAPHPAAGLR